MSKQSELVKSWRRKTKELIVTSMGSKCVICGYNSCNGALELHHLDKSTKLFSFGGLRARPMAWPIVAEELKKCILVCSNCHKEIEADLVDVSLMKSTYNESLILLDNSDRIHNVGIKNCKNSNCLKTFRAYNSNQLYCSISCRQNHTLKRTQKHPVKKTKIHWPGSNKLQQMVNEFGYVKTGKVLGVSDNAVRKRLKKYSRVAQ